MHYQIFTLFPDYFHFFFRLGIMGRAVQNGLVNYSIINFRKYGLGKHKQVDDSPYGGGSGMLLKKDVLEKAFLSRRHQKKIYLSPRGERLTQVLAKKLAQEKLLTVLCGHYEGVDQRFIEKNIDLEITVGDYILFQGETAAITLMEVVSRLLPGFLGNELSLESESFEHGLLENDQFTRPGDKNLPEVLLSGNHAKISNWRKNNQILNTLMKRPDLFKRKKFSEAEEVEFKKYLFKMKGVK